MESMHEGRIRRCASSSRLSHTSDAVADADDADDAVERQCGPEKTLGTLLENYEDLLLKVLLYIMEDGLHECRRVCRRWRDACGKLPVKLGNSYLDKMPRVIDLFPEAASWSMTRYLDSNDDVERQAMQHLSRLKNLQDLGLSMRSEQTDVNSLLALSPSTDCLRSITLLACKKDTPNDFLHALRLLTNLDKLIIDDFDFDQEDVTLDPVTELRRLRYLSAPLMAVVNNRGEVVFPSLTKLTHLDVFADLLEFPQIFSSLQVKEFRHISDL